MDTREMTELCEVAILERRELQLDYSRVDGIARWARVVAPFDVGSRDPARPHNGDKLFAFSALHRMKVEITPCTSVVAISIPNITAAVLLDSRFDPQHCREVSMSNSRTKKNPHGYDWGAIPRGFNLLPDRDWFR